MSKVSFANMKLKPVSTSKTITFNDTEIEVLDYISTENKIDLVQIALQKAEENGIYNEIKLDAYFHLNIVYLYTNINFTDKQKEDELRLFDLIKANGLLDNILEAMDENEYNYLIDMCSEIKDEILEYGNSAGAVVRSFIQDLPKNAEAAKNIVENFDPNQYQAVIDFANAANGGKVIPMK